ncbi:WG repeat-containing protein [Psychrobacter sp. DAB_AL62B]|uniref:WG repeat-containing protein n=1 Tax=Psychrobacter sp. DAB_AL62B TaxID=1028420 RepID=UPI00238130A8|nr:WG repeat-containing protein [Psychrobacter sp. DAB_AL62B]MDE4454042.1 WG repeat-containing protein [Psychrobacter sp. DAB_AL62B]
MIKKTIKAAYTNFLSSSMFFSAVAAATLMTTSAQATINCAGYLPNSYFERIENNNERFADKLVTLEDNSQQLQDLNGNILLAGLTDAYALMNKYLIASKDTAKGKKTGVVNAAGEIIVPFAYDAIATEPDIYTSFIVNVTMPDGATNQGIIDRDGYWVYPAIKNNERQQQRRIDNGYGDYSDTRPTQRRVKAVDAPLNLTAAAISHAHYDSDDDRDYFLINALGDASTIGKIGLLNDQGKWVIAQQYEDLQPLNACAGQLLYLQAVSTSSLSLDKVETQQQTALLDQNANIIIPFAPNQNIELFNNWVSNNGDHSLLFLSSTLIKGSIATGLTQDIEDNIVSAQIIDSKGKLILASEAAIVKLLYHQFYAYKRDGKFGFIDDQANIVLEPQFDSYRDEGDKVWVEKSGEMVRLNTLIELD